MFNKFLQRVQRRCVLVDARGESVELVPEVWINKDGEAEESSSRFVVPGVGAYTTTEIRRWAKRRALHVRIEEMTVRYQPDDERVAA